MNESWALRNVALWNGNCEAALSCFAGLALYNFLIYSFIVLMGTGMSVTLIIMTVIMMALWCQHSCQHMARDDDYTNSESL